MATPSTSPSPLDPATVPRTLRLMVTTFAAALVMITLLSLVAVPPAEEDIPVTVLVLGVLLVALGAFAARVIGFRTTPLTPSDVDESTGTALRTSLARFQVSTLLRLALTEAPFLVVFAASLVLPYGPWPVVVALAPGLVLMVLLAWPSRRNVRWFTERLEADGVRSGLPDAFAHG